MVLGAAVAAAFGLSGQISGGYAALCVGFSAPALLSQLGNVPQVAAAVAGATPEPGEGTSANPPPVSGASAADVSGPADSASPSDSDGTHRRPLTPGLSTGEPDGAPQ